MLVLFMIVKNESKIIERCLDSVKSIVSAIVITDTGSTDNTIELIDNYLSTNKIPGKVYNDEWKNFGHNRTRSFQNAQDWLKTNDYNLQECYGLTIDADMIFKIDPSFELKLLDSKDSWNLQQKNSSMTYYNKRLFRSSLAYKCISVTHEYWGCDDKDESGNRDDLYIDDIGDGGAKADKFERDIRLLTQGLIDEPKNERYLFYLAQSYSNLGKKTEAIEFYKKRIEVGGWFEEIFISYLHLGEIYDTLKEVEKAIHYWSLGYEHLHSRSETLFRIVNKYRHMGKNKLALLYLEKALKIPYPKDQVLFIEHPVYNYRLLEELSICGFYTQRRHESFIACDLLTMKPDTRHLKDQAYSNLYFYLQKLNAKKYQIMDLEQKGPFISSSPSLMETDTGYEGNVRMVNYSINKKFQYTMRNDRNDVVTDNYWVTLNDTFKVENSYQIKLGENVQPKRDSHIKGLEDMRLCKWGKNNVDYIGFAVSFQYGPHAHPSVCICHYEKKDDEYYISNVFPTTYNSDSCQKNWAPFVEDDNLLAIYSYHPLTIVKVQPNSGETSIYKIKENNIFNLSGIRGSTSPVQLPDGSWIMCVHEVVHRDTRKYFHRFLMYTKDWEFKDISLPFYFKELYVEFTLSISFKNNEITVYFSMEDNTSEMLSINLDDIKMVPKDTNEWIKETF